MRKSLAALVLAATAFTVTSASAAGYTISVDSAVLKVPSSGTAPVTTISVNGCPNADVFEKYIQWTGDRITDILIRTSDTSCNAPVRVTLANASNTRRVVYYCPGLTDGVGWATVTGGPGWNFTPRTGDGLVATMTVEILPVS